MTKSRISTHGDDMRYVRLPPGFDGDTCTISNLDLHHSIWVPTTDTHIEPGNTHTYRHEGGRWVYAGEAA